MLLFETTVSQLDASIRPLDQRAIAEAKRRWDSIAHPLGSLGLLERDIIQIAGITGSADVDLSRRAVVVMCADNGVVAEGVTQTGQEVTAIVTENMSKGDTSVCRMAKVAGAAVIPVDIGVAQPVAGERIRQSCVRRGTANMTQGPAMTREEAAKALLTGVSLVEELKKEGHQIFATGEMGIGNTTTASAVVSVLVDGFISSAAALLAASFCPLAKDYMLGSHASNEPAGRIVLEALGLTPFLYAGMCLGEGTGAVAVMPLLDMALSVYREMATFDEIEVEAYQPLT